MFDMYRRRRLGFLACLAACAFGGLQFAASSNGAHPAVRYAVQPGDSIWAIASGRYSGDPRSSVAAIEAANKLSGDLLRPGQLLLLP